MEKTTGFKGVYFSLWALWFFCLAGCGYRWEGEERGVVLPFVKGDETGLLTKAVGEALCQAGYRVGGEGDLLQVEVLEGKSETIGFRRDPIQVQGNPKAQLQAIEARRVVRVQVSLYRGGELKWGPYEVEGEADYDYLAGDSYQDLTFVAPGGNVVTMLPFSLGQLEPLEAAQEGAAGAAYRRVAQKIVDVISSEW